MLQSILCRQPDEIPLLIKMGLSDVIKDINVELDKAARAAGRTPCDPGRVLERVRKGRLIVQDWHWAEDQYSPATDSRPDFDKYLRKWIKANLPCASLRRNEH